MTASEVLYVAGLACGAAGLLMIAGAGLRLAWLHRKAARP